MGEFDKIISYDNSQFMLIFDNITNKYKLYRKFSDRRYYSGYKRI